MRPDRRPRWMRQGNRSRSDFAPEDLVRGLERKKARFMPNVVVDPSAWRIARMVARELRGSHGEGLRGAFVPNEGEHGRIYWWPSHVASHHQGRLLLGMDLDRSSQTILEVEANVHHDTTIFFQFGISKKDFDGSPMVDTFLRHPTIRDHIDGCLGLKGRLVVIDIDGCIRLTAQPPSNDPKLELRERRMAAWTRLEEQASAWARSRRSNVEDGRAMPDRRSLASYRCWLTNERWSRGHHPLPSVQFEGGSIVLTWKGSDLHGSLRFDGTTMSSRVVRNGRWKEHGPVDVSTKSRMRRNGLSMGAAHDMKDDAETIGPKPQDDRMPDPKGGRDRKGRG